MREQRKLAAMGAAVLILHHVAKNEGSSGRGSNTIPSHCNIRFVQQMDDDDPSLLTLKCGKTRLGARFSTNIPVDYHAKCYRDISGQSLPVFLVGSYAFLLRRGAW